jgi:hypothetical protein
MRKARTKAAKTRMKNRRPPTPKVPEAPGKKVCVYVRIILLLFYWLNLHHLPRRLYKCECRSMLLGGFPRHQASRGVWHRGISGSDSASDSVGGAGGRGCGRAGRRPPPDASASFLRDLTCLSCRRPMDYSTSIPRACDHSMVEVILPRGLLVTRVRGNLFQRPSVRPSVTLQTSFLFHLDTKRYMI